MQCFDLCDSVGIGVGWTFVLLRGISKPKVNLDLGAARPASHNA